MKLTQTTLVKRNSGMTLIELTVVILVLLALIAVLFVGAKAYKDGADKAACVMNIRNIQQAVRSEANLANIAIAGLLDSAFIVSKGYFSSDPVCPAAKAVAPGYTYAAAVPAVGSLYAVCKKDALGHVPAVDTKTNW